jgi:ATP phosphoribosyltransferase
VGRNQRSPEDSLIIAVPKGRVLTAAHPALSARRHRHARPHRGHRQLIRRDTKRGVSFLLLKPDDVPTYVEYGAADVGVVGRDVLLEREYDLYAPIDLGIGRCNMMVCGVPGSYPCGSVAAGARCAWAPSSPTSPRSHFRQKGLPVETIFLQGSVELAPLTGLADVIVDLVETGETLKQNGLAPLELVVEVSSVVVANRAGFKLKRELIAPLLAALKDSE